MGPDLSEYLLDGKVVLQVLPVFDSVRAAPEAKRMLLPQGEFTLLWPACPEIRFLAYLTFPRGSQRGNHGHYQKTELLYILTGRLVLHVLDMTNANRSQREITAGTLVRIAPGVAHVFVALEDASAIEFSPDAFDPTDTVKLEVA